MTRERLLKRLRDATPFDLLVIGGGATGCGIALDAATRGLDVALIERGDFAQETSSKSTKLAHGGVRYLEKAILHFDREQFSLVREGLRERGYLLQNAPHLAHPIQLLTPVDKWLDVAYIFAGLTLYDLLAGSLGLGASRFVPRSKLPELFPTLRIGNAKGAVLYYDGQFNDARMAVALARTANMLGSTCLNHIEAVSLIKQEGRTRGAIVRDTASNQEWSVHARCVINATGPFIDTIRRMDDPDVAGMLQVSSGIHLVLDAGFTPPDRALMVPETEDGRVLFMIPWQGHVLFGTTDNPATLRTNPVPTAEDVDYLLRYANQYLEQPVTRDDIRAAWCGLRPLVLAPHKGSTQEIARTHVIDASPSGLMTIAGGKWTSYRRMAEDVIDEANRIHGLGITRPCVTRDLKIIGSRSYVRGGHTEIARVFAIDEELARSLYSIYGDETPNVLAIGRDASLMERLHPAHPYIKAEVAFAARYELAEHLTDVLVRRFPLGLLNTAHALQAAPAAADIMAAELGWDYARRDEEVGRLEAYLAGWKEPFES